MDRELSLFDRPLEMCYCVPGGASACSPCRERRAVLNAENQLVLDYRAARDAERADWTEQYRRKFDSLSARERRALYECTFSPFTPEQEKKVEAYAGHEADFVVFDEAAQITGAQVEKMMRPGAVWWLPQSPREEGDRCMDQSCTGLYETIHTGDGCFCHVGNCAPCSYCVDTHLECSECGDSGESLFSSGEISPALAPRSDSVDAFVYGMSPISPLTAGTASTFRFPADPLKTYTVTTQKNRDREPSPPVTATEILKAFEEGQKASRDLHEQIFRTYYAALLGVS